MRKLKGTVVSDKMSKTRIVAVERLKRHKRYHKHYKVTKRYKAHDENNEYKVGDKVVIQESRPMSKEKMWKIVEKI
jgi:small subunit ribosomal protein S17